MRPVSVFANGPDGKIDQLRTDLHCRWRQASRAVMVLSLHGLPIRRSRVALGACCVHHLRVMELERRLKVDSEKSSTPVFRA
jgi:hypothetical protein